VTRTAVAREQVGKHERGDVNATVREVLQAAFYMGLLRSYMTRRDRIQFSRN
jgi:hypothetical protein